MEVSCSINNHKTEYNGTPRRLDDFMSRERLTKGKIFTFYDTDDYGKRTGRVFKVKIIDSYPADGVYFVWWNKGELIRDEVIPKTRHYLEVDEHRFKNNSAIVVEKNNYEIGDILVLTLGKKKYVAEIVDKSTQNVMENYELLYLTKASHCYEENYGKPKRKYNKKSKVARAIDNLNPIERCIFDMLIKDGTFSEEEAIPLAQSMTEDYNKVTTPLEE